MCDEFMEYLYPILNRDFKLAIDQNDEQFNSQCKNCWDYLDQIEMPDDLYYTISDNVQQDFAGSHPLDKTKLISFIAIAKLYDFEVMNTVFTHFYKYHHQLFFNLTYMGENMKNTDASIFVVYKYCCDKATSI